MSYDHEMVERIRRVFTEIAPVEERRMFGGVAFLVGGKMVVAASHQGDLMVRVDPGNELDLAQKTGVELRPMEMRGRVMSGWCRISVEDLADDEVLHQWIDRAVDSLGAPPGTQGT
ncbi:MAG: TfoX/Sxy family protein [Acidimicrobiales bacterium]